MKFLRNLLRVAVATLAFSSVQSNAAFLTIWTNQFTTNLVATNITIKGEYQGNTLNITNGSQFHGSYLTNLGDTYLNAGKHLKMGAGGKIRADNGTEFNPGYQFGSSGSGFSYDGLFDILLYNNVTTFHWDSFGFWTAGNRDLGKSVAYWANGYIDHLFSTNIEAVSSIKLQGTNLYSLRAGSNITFTTNGTQITIAVPVPVYLGIAASDETTALTSGTNKVVFRSPFAFTLTGVRGSLTTAQSAGGLLTVDINENLNSVLSTKMTFDNGEKTTVTAVTQPVLSDTSIADDSEIEVDIDGVGTSGATGLKVWLLGTKP